MTAAIHSAPSLSIPPSQNTAPVLEFRCLYSHDLRRKSKRWQDGFLRYHTFNKRVMVYDVPRNFIGDTHWKETTELREGDEITLEKGVLVEVAEAVGTMKTDLTPLFERTSKVSPNNKTAEVRPNPKLSVQNTIIYKPSQLRHKSLNTILGTPKGPHGKAILPAKSPYESRKDAENRWQDERAPKRQKIINSKPMNNQSRPLEIHQPGSKNASLWARTVDARVGEMSKQASKVGNREPQKGTSLDVIEIGSDTDNVFSDVTLPSTLLGFQRAVSPRRTAQLRQSPLPAQQLSPSFNVSERVLNVERGDAIADRPTTNHAEEPIVSPPRNPRAKALRLSSGRSRSTLLCQAVPQQQSRITDQTENASRHEVQRYSEDSSLFEAIDWDSASLQEPKDHNIAIERVLTSGVHRESLKTNEVGSDLLMRPLENQPVLKKSNGMTSNAKSLRKQKHSSMLKDPISDISDSPSSSSDAFEEMTPVPSRMDQLLLTSISSANKPKAASASKPTKPTFRQKAAPRHIMIVDSPSAEPARGRKRCEVQRTVSNTSPRAFRRVRSVNDAPIPSTAEDWETKNAPKPQRKLLRSKSINATKAPAKKDQSPPLPPPPPVDTDVGPWSTEAFDLFDWRPPGRDSDGKPINEGNEEAVEI